MSASQPISSVIDFETGRLGHVVRALHGSTKREYVVLGVVLLLSIVPYAVLFCYEPLGAIWLTCVLAFLQVIVTFATSVQTTGTSHHMRFLLAGKNPIAMTGGASLLLGGVDALFDWREDRAARRHQPFRFWLQFLFKFMATPLGLIVMLAESLWDVVLLSRGLRLVGCKRREFFALSRYHDLVCPEKSNDIFYADLAFARYLDDPYLYQWNRLRALVFEIQHYHIDVEDGIGVPETNLLRQDSVTGYQTLKRLEAERIEVAVAQYYRMYPDRFLLPPRLTAILVRNARPIEHYLRFRKQMLVDENYGETDLASNELRELVCVDAKRPTILPWHLLRIMDEPRATISAKTSPYLGEHTIDALVDRKILQPVSGKGDQFQLTPSVRDRLDFWLDKYFREATNEEVTELTLSRLPRFLHYNDRCFVPRTD